MAKKAKCACKKSEECEECPEWIFTFADLVMLMMGFFVILWVLKPSATPQPNTKTGEAQTEQWLETAGQIRSEFGWAPDPKGADPVDQAVLRMRVRNGPGERGEVVHPPKGAQGTDSEVMSIGPGQQAI